MSAVRLATLAGVAWITGLTACIASGSAEKSPSASGAGGTDAGSGSTPGRGGGGANGAVDGSSGTGGSPSGSAGSGGALEAGRPGDAADSASGDATRGGVGCTSLPLCDDFESATPGGPPDTAKWQVGAPNVTGQGTLAIDGAVAHSGNNSVRVAGKAGYSNHIFFFNDAAVSAIGKEVFGRMFVRFEQPLADGHATFLAMKDNGDMKDLRLGGQAKILMYNRESNDATLPALSPAGIAKSLQPPVLTWLCVEFRIDGNSGEIQTWIDGNEVEGLHADATPTPDIDQQWSNGGLWKPNLTDVKFGWESYAGGDMTLWFDDVALAAQRIGCD